MTDWDFRFQALPDAEKDKIALLRIIECSNGVIQSLFRNGDHNALSLEETRRAMKYSMRCMKTQTISLRESVITVAPETAKIMSEVRELYISGFKKNNTQDYEEFMKASIASLNFVSKERILIAKETALNHIDELPSHTLDWGLNYIFGLMQW